LVRSRNATATHRTFALILILAVLVPWSAGPASAKSDPVLKVMTRNLYLGADLGPVLAVTSFEQLVQQVGIAWAKVQATDFPERAGALADEIAEFDPHVVGLQEVELWRSQIPGDGPISAATTVELDFLDLLLDALAARGSHYEPIAVVTNLDVEAPRLDLSSPNFLQDIRLTDRDVILARTDLPTDVFSVSNGQGARFDVNLSLVGPVLGEVILFRGWTAVDATIQDRTVRIVNTHLERLSPFHQVAQGQEILAGPANSPLPVVLLGDLNSAAGAGAVPGESDTPTYDNIIAAGFSDAWSVKRDEDGFTCCHAEDLLNVEPTLTERIDFVLVRGSIAIAAATRVGEEEDDRTPSALWPSDHSGVSAVLRLR
jgi:endonuclease/exonuclease/phosphatase family metal-dependent hydrolase